MPETVVAFDNLVLPEQIYSALRKKKSLLPCARSSTEKQNAH